MTTLLPADVLTRDVVRWGRLCSICDSDVTKVPGDDRTLATRGVVREVTGLMVLADGDKIMGEGRGVACESREVMMLQLTALSFHRLPMYMPECIARNLIGTVGAQGTADILPSRQ